MIFSITHDNQLIASFLTQFCSEARALQMPCPLSTDARAAAADGLSREEGGGGVAKECR